VGLDGYKKHPQPSTYRYHNVGCVSMAAGPDSTSSSEIYGVSISTACLLNTRSQSVQYFRAPPANQDFVFFEEMLPFQNVPEVLLPSTSFNISDPHESIPGIPLDAPQVYDWELLRVACSVSGLLSPPILPPQATTFPSPQTTTFPSQATVFSPPNWRKIPQKTYSYGLKQWNFTPLESILFSVNGRPGVNMGDALRKVFTGLDGRDDLVLQDASSAISCRLSVRSS